MKEKISKLRDILKEDSIAVKYLNKMNRVEWLAFFLGIRKTILLEEPEAEYFKEILGQEKYYLHILKEYPGTYFVSKCSKPYQWDNTKSKQSNFGIFLEYPDVAIKDFEESEGPRSTYCLDYKIFTLSNSNQEVWEDVNKLKYSYVSSPSLNYKGALQNFYEKFNLEYKKESNLIYSL